MNDIPDFAEALGQFRRFLSDNGHPDEVFWVFREDLWQLSPTRMLIKYPPPSENASLAQKVFAEGRARGLVEIMAIAATANKVAATVWFPKYADEKVQGWDGGMKLVIIQPLPGTRAVSALWWNVIQILPRFQRYQRAEWLIGTKAWAAA